MTGGPPLRSAESPRDLHDRAVADGPVEQLPVERPLALGIARFDLPVHHRTRPVVCHPGNLLTTPTLRGVTADDLVELELIKRLKYRYIRCLDLKLFDEVGECFVDDATASY